MQHKKTMLNVLRLQGGTLQCVKMEYIRKLQNRNAMFLRSSSINILENLSPGERPAELGYFLKDERKANSMTLNDIFIHLS